MSNEYYQILAVRKDGIPYYGFLDLVDGSFIWTHSVTLCGKFTKDRMLDLIKQIKDNSIRVPNGGPYSVQVHKYSSEIIEVFLQ